MWSWRWQLKGKPQFKSKQENIFWTVPITSCRCVLSHEKKPSACCQPHFSLLRQLGISRHLQYNPKVVKGQHKSLMPAQECCKYAIKHVCASSCAIHKLSWCRDQRGWGKGEKEGLLEWVKDGHRDEQVGSRAGSPSHAGSQPVPKQRRAHTSSILSACIYSVLHLQRWLRTK